MPIYEYHCAACGAVFERMLGWTEADVPPACPNCASFETRRKGAPAVILQVKSSPGISIACGSGDLFR